MRVDRRRKAVRMVHTAVPPIPRQVGSKRWGAKGGRVSKNARMAVPQISG